MSLIDSSLYPPMVINFNSKDRIGGTNSSFISKPVDLGINKYNSVCLVQASIPKSWFNMPSGYNVFTLIENSVSIPITIPVGNYTKINLATTLASVLTTASLNGCTYTITYSNYTQPDNFRYTFAVTGNVGFQPEFYFDDNSPFRQLGFERLTNYAFVADTLIGENAVNLSYILRLFIKTDLVQNATDGVLQELLSVGSFAPQSIVFYQQYDFDMNHKDLNPNNINSWGFSLVDDFDQLVDLNGINWAFSIVFYQRSITHELQKNDLMIKNEERLFKIEQEQSALKNYLEASRGNEPVAGMSLQPTDTKAPPNLQPIFPILTNYIIEDELEPEPTYTE